MAAAFSKPGVMPGIGLFLLFAGIWTGDSALIGLAQPPGGYLSIRVFSLAAYAALFIALSGGEAVRSPGRPSQPSRANARRGCCGCCARHGLRARRVRKRAHRRTQHASSDGPLRDAGCSHWEPRACSRFEGKMSARSFWSRSRLRSALDPF